MIGCQTYALNRRNVPIDDTTRSFLIQRTSSLRNWNDTRNVVAPDRSSSFQNTGSRGFPLVSAERNERRDILAGVPPGFTLSEFARLLVLTRDDAQNKRPIERSVGRSLTRSEVDALVTSASY